MIEATFRDEDAQWLKAAMITALTKAKSSIEYTYEFRWQLERIVEALSNPKELGPDEPLVPGESKSTPKKMSSTQTWDLCLDHPHYGAKRAPRSSCMSCWNVYKRLNPTKYHLAWRKFQSSQ